MWSQQPAGLPPNLSEEAVWLWNRALGITARNPSQVILVSRFRFERLRPLRSWQDLERLREYVEWADRAEGFGFSGDNVVADVSRYDLILLRWPASSLRTKGKLVRDPIGFAVLDPGREGRVEIPVTALVTQARAPELPPNLPVRAVPAIRGVVARTADIIEIYGENLSGREVYVETPAGRGNILYVSPNQINARVPSRERVAVSVDGIRSDWAEVRR